MARPTPPAPRRMAAALAIVDLALPAAHQPLEGA